MSAHTKGPWVFDVDGPGWDIHVTSGGPFYVDGSRSIAVWHRSFADQEGHDERIANARLIAAAPRMLALIQMLKDHVTSGAGFAYPLGSLQEIDAILSQASGEAA